MNKVSAIAIDFLTTLFANLAGSPPATFVTLSVASSVFKSSTCFLTCSGSFFLSSLALP
jgi:hypothetical protein